MYPPIPDITFTRKSNALKLHLLSYKASKPRLAAIARLLAKAFKKTKEAQKQHESQPFRLHIEELEWNIKGLNILPE